MHILLLMVSTDGSPTPAVVFSNHDPDFAPFLGTKKEAEELRQSLEEQFPKCEYKICKLVDDDYFHLDW